MTNFHHKKKNRKKVACPLYIFKYLADEFNKEELIIDIILEKTVYAKNEFAEFVYDEAFSAMTEYFYEK